MAITVFALAMAKLLGISAVVVGGLRLLLRRWQSLWGKGLAVHVVNIGLNLFVMPTVLPSVAALFTNGALLLFLLLVMAADLARALLMRNGARRFAPGAAFVGILVLALAAAWFSTRAAATALAFQQTALRTLLGQSPEREILPALTRDFPDDAQPLLQAYAAALRPGEPVPRFALAPVDKLIAQKSALLATAPDAELLRVAQAMRDLVHGYASFPAACAAIVTGRRPVNGPNLAAPASARDRHTLGVFMASMLDAMRAGRDQPVQRPYDSAAQAALTRDFASRLPASLRGSAPNMLSDTQGCAMSTAYVDWLASLPGAQAAQYLRAQHQATP
jgi:hypothetical protein